MGLTSGVETLPALFWGTFVAMLAVQPVYGWLTSRFRRTVFLPWVYLFFILNIVCFYAWFNAQDDHTWIARVYFVWVSVFNLFVVAVFWSLMADVFTREQAGRLFGFIAAGLSLGGLFGPFLGKQLAQPIGTINLLLVSAVLLAVGLGFMLAVLRWHRRHGTRDARRGRRSRRAPRRRRARGVPPGGEFAVPRADRGVRAAADLGRRPSSTSSSRRSSPRRSPTATHAPSSSTRSTSGCRRRR